MNHTVSNCKRIIRKCLKNRRFLKKPYAQNLQHIVKAAIDLQFFLDNRHQHVDANGDPNLRLDRVVGVPVKGLDAKVLLDPFEEQLDLPAAAVQLRDGQGRQVEVVGQEDQVLVDVGGVVPDPPKRVGIELGTLWASQYDRAVALETRGLVHLSNTSPGVIHGFFASRNETGQSPGKGIEAGEIDVSPVHDVDGARFDRQQGPR